MNPFNMWDFHLKKALEEAPSVLEKAELIEKLLREHGGELIAQRAAAKDLYIEATKATDPFIREVSERAYKASEAAITRSEQVRDVLREAIAQLRLEARRGDGWSTGSS